MSAPQTSKSQIKAKTASPKSSSSSKTRSVLERTKPKAVDSNEKKMVNEKGTESISSSGYYFLKLTARSWKAGNFREGLECWFHTHLGGRRRQEYELFEQITVGDTIVGYSEEFDAIVCEFKVTEAIHTDIKGDEKILFRITKVYANRIPLAEVQTTLPFINELSASSSIRLFRLDKPLFGVTNDADNPAVESGLAYTDQQKNIITTEVAINIANYTTEGNHTKTDDKLEFENDIESMAVVMSLESVKPPLAIGLFGKWGSGKSFFMEKLYNKVKEFSKYDSEGFVKNVVQVRFNSWHYTDSNLWASIVSEIFEALNLYAKKGDEMNDLKKLQDSLLITNKQKELAESRKQKLETNIGLLQKDQDEKRQRLEHLTAIGLIKRLIKDKEIKTELGSLKNKSVESILADAREINLVIKQMNSSWNVVKATWEMLKDSKGARWFFVIIGIMLLMSIVAAYQQLPFLNDKVEAFLKEWGVRTSVIVSIAGYLVKCVTPVIAQFNKAQKLLKSVKENLQKSEPDIDPKLDLQQRELAGLKTDLEQLDNSIKYTHQEIDDILSGSKLFEFIDQGSKNENYTRQLGLISLIRKDFNRLDELLRMQHDKNNTEKVDNPLHVKLRIDRIILYIDDLDRCDEDIVLKVLEAIHLLLAFPLFVVVVGVDPRWLNNALNVKYKSLFGINDKDLNGQGGSRKVATSYDYLEKIFQIPFCLKPINEKGRKNLIAYLVEHELDTVKTKRMNVSGKSNGASGNDAKEAEVSYELINNRWEEKKENDPGKDIVTETKIKALTKKMSFSGKELEFMQMLSPIYAASPRTIKRFVNIYRIIKSHKSIAVSRNFSKDDYAPLLILLSIVVGCSEVAQEFIAKLLGHADQSPFHEFLSSNKLETNLATALGNLDVEVKNYPVKKFKNNVELISRFSFRTLIE